MPPHRQHVCHTPDMRPAGGRGPGHICHPCGVRSPVSELTWHCPRCGGPRDPDCTAGPAQRTARADRMNSLWRHGEALPLSDPRTPLGEGYTRWRPSPTGFRPNSTSSCRRRRSRAAARVMLAEPAHRIGPRRVVADSSNARRSGRRVLRPRRAHLRPRRAQSGHRTGEAGADPGARPTGGGRPGNREAAAGRPAPRRTNRHLLRLARLRPALPARHKDVRVRTAGGPRRPPPSVPGAPGRGRRAPCRAPPSRWPGCTRTACSTGARVCSPYRRRRSPHRPRRTGGADDVTPVPPAPSAAEGSAVPRPPGARQIRGPYGSPVACSVRSRTNRSGHPGTTWRPGACTSSRRLRRAGRRSARTGLRGQGYGAAGTVGTGVRKWRR